jgi:group II intron reverse transcriptase/maturase
VPTLEDKVVQRAACEVMGAIYEADFLGFSYGFRAGRNQHNALDAVSVGITRRKVKWVLDADIRGFFDAIDHDWLVKFIEHRIADKRVVRHVKKWLHAGVFENGEWAPVDRGSPQGGSVSPMLANIYLHYVFDLWAHQWRTKQASGDVIIVRYADDIVMGFQHRAEAARFKELLVERFQKFGLELNAEKTRLIEFGRFAASNRAKRGQSKPETFDFLGFRHICAVSQYGKFKLLRKTIPSRQRVRLKAVYAELRRRMHDSIPETGSWLRRVVTGYYRYHAIPGNSAALESFRRDVIRLWRLRLRRRSHKSRLDWTRMGRVAAMWVPYPTVLHPWPGQRLHV